MQKLFYLFLTLLPAKLITAQSNVGIGTETPAGKLHIAGSENTSQLIIQSNTNGVQSNINPLLKMQNAGVDALWLHADDARSIYLGVDAGRSTFKGGVGIAGNIFIGHRAGASNTAGAGNVVVGSNSFENGSGNGNTSMGLQSLRHNNNGDINTAIGTSALRSNQNGSSNTAMGVSSLVNNSTGDYNVGVGASAGGGNTSGNNNTAIGYRTLITTTASDFNVAIGANAGDLYNNGFNNVFVGANSDVSSAGLYNIIAIGQSAAVAANNTARFGNTSTVSYGGYAGWTNVSDGRFKRNIHENVPGLAFISQLRPVTYTLAATMLDGYLKKGTAKATNANEYHLKALDEKEKITYTGFIAQEVETAAAKLGFNFSGVEAPKNDNDTYGLRYAEFVVPLVKAVQELKEENDLLKKELAAIKKMLENR